MSRFACDRLPKMVDYRIENWNPKESTQPSNRKKPETRALELPYQLGGEIFKAPGIQST